MLSKVYGAAVHGIDALIVTIEASASRGFSFTIVGLPDAAVKESYERVQSAISETIGDFPASGLSSTSRRPMSKKRVRPMTCP